MYVYIYRLEETQTTGNNDHPTRIVPPNPNKDRGGGDDLFVCLFCKSLNIFNSVEKLCFECGQLFSLFFYFYPCQGLIWWERIKD
mmetsp:Transcript_18379/g.34589  ORF Transcript_18379/g.34589 Transcript_18379/m.34589 type:complete len:85 (+) Transcript_18379:42-296(+)